MSASNSRLAEEISKSFQEFGSSRGLSEANEADTRCELIDRILALLGWPSGGFSREVSTTAGDFVDYELPRDGAPLLVLEAKRVGVTFALDPIPLEKGSRTRAMSTLLAKGGHSFRSAAKQAASYCNDEKIPYACVTNGYQWVFFRGLSSETRKWGQGRAIVFPSALTISQHIDLFRGCLEPANLASSQLARSLAQPTPRELPAPRTPINHVLFRGSASQPERRSLRREVARQLFDKIHGGDRSEMLDGCYVRPGIQPDFDRSLRRLLRDTLSPAPDGVEATEEVGAECFAGRIQELEKYGSLRSPVLVVGNVGVGKTTFLHKTLASLRAKPEKGGRAT